MRRLKSLFISIFRFLVFAVLWILVFVSVAVVAVIAWPNIVINNGARRILESVLARSHVQITSSGADLTARSLTLKKKEIILRYENLCLRIPHPHIDGCFPYFEADLTVRLGSRGLKLVSINSLTITSDHFDLFLEPPGPPTPENPVNQGKGFSVRDLFPRHLRSIVLHRLKLDLKKNHVRLASGADFKGDVLLSDDKTLSGPPPWRGHLFVNATETLSRSHVKLDLFGSGYGPALQSPVTVHGNLQVQGQGVQPAPFELTAHLFGLQDRFDFRLDSQNVCLARLPVSGCFQKVALGIKGVGKLTSIQIQDIDPLVFHGRDLKIASGPGSTQPQGKSRANTRTPSLPKSTEGFPRLVLPGIMTALNMGGVDVNLQRLTMGSGDQKLLIDLVARSLKKNESLAHEKWGLSLRARVSEPNLPLHAGALITFHQMAVAARASGKVQVKTPANFIKNRFEAALADPRHLDLHSKFQFEGGPWRAQGGFDGKMGPRAVVAHLKAHAVRGKLKLLVGEKAPCDVQILSAGLTTLDCSLVTAWEKTRFLARFPHFPGQARFHLAGFLRAPFPYSLQDPWTGKVQLKMEPFESSLFDGSAMLAATVNGQVLGRFSLNQLLLEDDLHLNIKHFAKTLAFLKGTEYFPPAPFNALHGQIELSSHGNIKGASGRIPLALNMDLHSEEQSLKALINANLGLARKNDKFLPKVVGDVNLNDVLLVLPHLGIGPPPPLVPDARIKSEVAAAASPSKAPSLDYDIGVITGAKPVRLVSNLTQAPIPVALKLHLISGQPVKGKVTVQSFPISLFRRKARIRFLEVSLISDRPDEDPISGEATVTYTDYIFHVLVSGNLKKPLIKLESDPPLPQDLIVSALLFGEPPGNLSTDQSGSVGSFQAALADRALGLASLYYLASTPVESIGYDPTHATVTAKIHIQQGLSLDLGASTGNALQEVGLNKRLGHSWVIRTFYTGANAATGTASSVTAFLEKVFRF